jgi:hypothetical protein
MTNEDSQELIPSRNIYGRFSCTEFADTGSSNDKGEPRMSDGQTILRRLMVDVGGIDDEECSKLAHLGRSAFVSS